VVRGRKSLASNPTPGAGARDTISPMRAGAEPRTTPATGDGERVVPELSVVMPCLDEAPTIGTCIRKAQNAFDRIGIVGEVVVADNGSTDGSKEIAEELGAHVVPVQERGYGAALTGGIAAARGRWVIMGDADDSYDFSDLEPFVRRLREGYELVNGNRFKGEIREGAMPWLHRRLGNPLLSFVGRSLYGTPCGDIYCGLRGFDREKVAALNIRSSGMEFAIEMVVKATMMGLRVTEVPTTLSPDAEGREPHLNTWRDGWRSIRLLLLYSPKWLFLYPGLLLLAFGVAGMAWLIPDERSIGGVGFDVSTLLYFALAVIVGLQAVYFFLTARWFGISEGLLPEDPLIRRIVERPRRLEWALLIGLLLVASGLGLSLYAVVTWNEAGFGRLDYPDTLRIVIPGATLIACGMQTAFSALFLGVLRLRRR
jgi:glycosyltransferase involved in cell wall biosynthesis